MSNQLQFSIDAKLYCYSFEDDDLDGGELKIATMFFGKLILLDPNYYMTKTDFETSGFKVIEGVFNHSNTKFNWNTLSDFDGTQKDFVIEIKEKVIFTGTLDTATIEKISTKSCDMINVSLNFGAKQGQIDLSTTKILKSNIHHLTSGV